MPSARCIGLGAGRLQGGRYRRCALALPLQAFDIARFKQALGELGRGLGRIAHQATHGGDLRGTYGLIPGGLHLGRHLQQMVGDFALFTAQFSLGKAFAQRQQEPVAQPKRGAADNLRTALA